VLLEEMMRIGRCGVGVPFDSFRIRIEDENEIRMLKGDEQISSFKPRILISHGGRQGLHVIQVQGISVSGHVSTPALCL